MNFSLIVCTYQRPEALLNLLQSVKEQSLYPDQILVVDGSINNKTNSLLSQHFFQNLEYFKVEKQYRGLTRQRNFGISKVKDTSQVLCFLDDDTVLTRDYFKELLDTYDLKPEAVGVGGYINNEIHWEKVGAEYQTRKGEFVYDGWKRTEGSRFQLRRKFGLAPDVSPGKMPNFSHGYSTGFLPPSGNIYTVDFFMGCSMSFKREVFDKVDFSTYFEGYGLYEDMDFCLRAGQLGKLYLSTKAKLDHHHDERGRPNKYDYGKMVVRNGWYVWRVKNPRPSMKNMLKWHSTTFLLMLIRMTNIWNTSKRKEALTEIAGRLMGWLSLIITPPQRTFKNLSTTRTEE